MKCSNKDVQGNCPLPNVNCGFPFCEEENVVEKVEFKLTENEILAVMHECGPCRENNWADHINFAQQILLATGLKEEFKPDLVNYRQGQDDAIQNMQELLDNLKCK